ncbi:MAG: phage terminase large subunit [Thiohalomonadales bacterium]
MLASNLEFKECYDELKRRQNNKQTVVGVVDPKLGLIHNLTKINGTWQLTEDQATVYLPQKLEIVLKSKKRFIIVIGGRGSGKSIGVADICLIDAKDEELKTYYLREFQSSIRNSVQSLLEGELSRLEFPGFEIQGNTVLHNNNPVAEFAGLARNVDSIKSAYGFYRYAIEESQFLAESSLRTLTPTARNKPNKGLPGSVPQEDRDMANVSMIFIANPGSSEDAFSKRFIEPFIDKLGDNGVYEDNLHLLVKMNYDDNPWYHESGLEDERLWDKEYRSDAAYTHIWLGAYNDSVDDALILTEWFDACIDAHLVLGFELEGAKIASHDPSDTGFDAKGYAMRHGSVFLSIEEKNDGDVNEGGHWAVDLAIQHKADYFTFDCDGMGAALNEQISKDFDGKQTKIAMFKGSESPDFPTKLYKPAKDNPVHNQQSIENVFTNKRNQYYWELMDRIYRTYRSVRFGEYADPDLMISFSSEIKLLSKVRAEVCRLPVKPNANGFLTLYTKQEMKSKFKLKSANLADSLMMNMRYINPQRQVFRKPKPVRPLK